MTCQIGLYGSKLAYHNSDFIANSIVLYEQLFIQMRMKRYSEYCVRYQIQIVPDVCKG